MSADTLSSILLPVVDAGRLSDPDPIVAAFQAMAVFGLLCVDRFDMVDELLRTALRHARERGTVAAEQQASVLLGTSLLWQGSLTAAEEEFRRGRTLGAGQRGHATLGLVDALLRQGKTDDVARYAQELGLEEIDAPTLAPLVRIERGRLLVADGRLREGLDEFMVAGNESLEAGIVNPAASPWRADAAMVLSTLGEWPEAGRLATEHLQLARRFGAVRSIGIGLRAAAAATPDLIERTTLLAEAVDLLEPSPARLEASYALVELGMVLVERMKKEEARSVLRRGANLASLCGAHQLVESAGTQLRAAGARPRRLGQVGLESLTPAELRVARLAASGMTNQGIATDLYVSVKTVEGHLVKTYRKLGVDSRRGLTRVLGSDDGECGSLLDAS